MSTASVESRAPRDRTILVAGMGTSPAVLTETVWALAHQEQPVVPDEIVVITTKSGKEALRTAVMSGAPSVWERLKAALRKEKIAIDGKLVFGDTSIRVMPDEKGNEIVDLRTGADNLRAADFMLGELRKYTEDTETTILCSIAGGRKTMSALLFSCMSLLGREQDKVYHVLIPPAYECGMVPPFYFPQKGVTHQLISRGKLIGKKIPAAKIGIELFEVPFVCMRGWYHEKFKVMPPSYRTLISRVQEVAPPALAYPEITIDVWCGIVSMNGTVVRLSSTCLVALILLAQGRCGSRLHRDMLAVHQCGCVQCDWLASFKEGSRFRDESSTEDLNKVLSELRKKLSSAGFVAVESLVPQRGRATTFPLAHIRWVNRKKMADICGCLFPRVAK